MVLHKDEALDELARIGNVAQFVAYRPDGGRLRQTFSRVRGYDANADLGGIDRAAAALLAASPDGAVNVRSYLPDDPRSREFVYGIRDASDAAAHLARLGGEGLHVILNETVDVADGGVSGVAQGGVLEFPPDDTPRAVEKPGVATLSREIGLDILRTVYRFDVKIPGSATDRVEFSVHPSPRGWRTGNVLLREIERGVEDAVAPPPRWPNRFSAHLGDKAFGLLVADRLGAQVPRTTVIGRRVAPFSFGRPTGNHETWLRTAPREPEPGLFSTHRGWPDPFELVKCEDPERRIAAVLAQDGVEAAWSGAAIVDGEGRLVVEGRSGRGDMLMLGEEMAEPLPREIGADVAAAHGSLAARLGPVRIEWVHDGRAVWIVQLHIGATTSANGVIVVGDPERWVAFDASQGLEELRTLVASLPAGAGVEVSGRIGLTSHLADVLRKRGLPARLRG